MQACPRALIALRYFHELMPTLHVIAAGSLLDFAIGQVGIPVGRVQFLHMHPMSFREFLYSQDEMLLVTEIMKHESNETMPDMVHEKALRLRGEYIAIGGMSEVVLHWRNQKNYHQCLEIQHDLISAYKQDFEKYATRSQIKYVEHIFIQAAHQLSARFRYSHITGEFRKRELAPAMQLLQKANVIMPVIKTSANDVPLMAHANMEHFKIIMFDVALSQVLLGLAAEQWILNAKSAFANKGSVAEAYVGQELLAYSNPREETHLYFWQLDKRGGEAEIDYVIARNQEIIPIEVKAGHGSTLRSLHTFLKTHEYNRWTLVSAQLAFLKTVMATASSILYVQPTIPIHFSKKQID